MNFEGGNRHFPLWVLSDLEPSYLEENLKGPFDYRHPSRHIVCTSVFNAIQLHVYKSIKKRVDEDSFSYYTTFPKKVEKPKINDVIWEKGIHDEISELKKDMDTYGPTIILAFGAFTYELLRRTQENSAARSYGSWTPAELGGEFKTCVNDFDINAVNILPLMDRSILGWKFLESHEQFVGKKNADYFQYAGREIARLLVTYQDELDIWIK